MIAQLSGFPMAALPTLVTLTGEQGRWKRPGKRKPARPARGILSIFRKFKPPEIESIKKARAALAAKKRAAATPKVQPRTPAPTPATTKQAPKPPSLEEIKTEEQQEQPQEEQAQEEPQPEEEQTQEEQQPEEEQIQEEQQQEATAGDIYDYQRQEPDEVFTGARPRRTRSRELQHYQRQPIIIRQKEIGLSGKSFQDILSEKIRIETGSKLNTAKIDSMNNTFSLAKQYKLKEKGESEASYISQIAKTTLPAAQSFISHYEEAKAEAAAAAKKSGMSILTKLIIMALIIAGGAATVVIVPRLIPKK